MKFGVSTMHNYSEAAKNAELLSIFSSEKNLSGDSAEDMVLWKTSKSLYISVRMTCPFFFKDGSNKVWRTHLFGRSHMLSFLFLRVKFFSKDGNMHKPSEESSSKVE